MTPLSPSVSARLLAQRFAPSLLLLLSVYGCRIDEGLIDPQTAEDPRLKETRGIVFIAYDRSSGADGGEVYIINPDGTNLRCLTKDTDTVSFMSAAWSPDMTRLAAVWVPGGGQGKPLRKSVGPADKKQRCLGLVDGRGRRSMSWTLPRKGRP